MSLRTAGVKKGLFGDFLIAGEIVIIGLAAAAHLAAIVLGWSFSSCALLFGGLVCGALAGVTGMLLFRRRKAFCRGEAEDSSGKPFVPEEAGGSSGKSFVSGKAGRPVLRRFGRTEGCLYAVFALIFLSQLIFICMGDTNYREGDMTVETVGSFLASDALYQVNPMTGLPYTQGIPSRLKILCLPTLYASLSWLTGVSPMAVVWKVIPVITLVSSYAAFTLLSGSFFPETPDEAYREKRACFMTIVSLLMWAGAYQPGMDGFQLLCGGWMGVTIRNLVLLPWLLSLCLRRKWIFAALCIPAEACMVWTLYGCGVCLPFLLCMGILQGCCRMGGRTGKKDGGQNLHGTAGRHFHDDMGLD